MTAIKKTIVLLFEMLNKAQTAIATFAMAGLATLVCIQVFLRYVLNSPLFGVEEVQEFFAIWVYFFGGTMASYQKSHIQCGILGIYIKNSMANYVANILRDVLSAGLAFFLAYSIYDYTRYVTKIWKLSSILRIPTVLGENAIIIAVVIMGIFAVRDAVQTIKAGPQKVKALGDAELEGLKAELGEDL